MDKEANREKKRRTKARSSSEDPEVDPQTNSNNQQVDKLEMDKKAKREKKRRRKTGSSSEDPEVDPQTNSNNQQVDKKAKREKKRRKKTGSSGEDSEVDPDAVPKKKRTTKVSFVEGDVTAEVEAPVLQDPSVEGDMSTAGDVPAAGDVPTGTAGEVPAKGDPAKDDTPLMINDPAKGERSRSEILDQELLLSDGSSSHVDINDFEEYPDDPIVIRDKVKIVRSAKKSAKHKYKYGEDSLEESSGSQDCMTCYKFVTKKKKKHKEKRKNSMKEKHQETKNTGKTIRWFIRWLVFIIGVGNFMQMMHESFNLLQYEMKFEYFFALGVYNCKEWELETYKGLLAMYTLHALASTLLLYGKSKKTSSFCLYWIASQVALSIIDILEGFFKFRFAPSGALTGFVVKRVLLIILDITEVSIVTLQYYLLDKPHQVRLTRLAASAHLDKTLNGEIFLQGSVFLQRKAGFREAANFQVVNVMSRLKDVHRTAGIHAPPDVVAREVGEALHDLMISGQYRPRHISPTPAPENPETTDTKQVEPPQDKPESLPTPTNSPSPQPTPSKVVNRNIKRGRSRRDKESVPMAL